jgi:hypothetical protein
MLRGGLGINTKARAQAKADEMKLAHRQHGDSILNDSVTNQSDVDAALELLKPYQATLVEAARFYVKNSNLIRDPRKVEDVKAELLQSKGQDSRSARYFKGSWSKAFPPLVELSPFHFCRVFKQATGMSPAAVCEARADRLCTATDP